MGRTASAKEKIVTELLLELDKGSERKDIISKYCKRFQKSDRTIDSYWKIAQERHQEQQQAIQKELLRDSTEKAKEALKKGLKSKEERMLQIQSIIDGTGAKLANGEILYPSFNDRIKAHELLIKLNGEFAPTKQKIEVSEKPVSDFLLEE